MNQPTSKSKLGSLHQKVDIRTFVQRSKQKWFICHQLLKKFESRFLNLLVYLLLYTIYLFNIFIYLLNIELNICEKREGNWKGVMWRVIVLTSCLWFAIGLAKHWSETKRKHLCLCLFVALILKVWTNVTVASNTVSLGWKKAKSILGLKKQHCLPGLSEIKTKSCCTLLKSSSVRATQNTTSWKVSLNLLTLAAEFNFKFKLPRKNWIWENNVPGCFLVHTRNTHKFQLKERTLR